MQRTEMLRRAATSRTQPWPRRAGPLRAGERPQRRRAQASHGAGEPGAARDQRRVHGAGEGAVRLLDVQRAGGKAGPAEVFLRGTAVPAGTRLG